MEKNENKIIINGFELDEWQMQLLNSNQNSIVIAGAGCGKTLTILGKIKYLIENKNINPNEILVISFTNASVDDIKSRIDYDVPVYTFHKLAIFILETLSFEFRISSQNMLQYITEEIITTIDINSQKLILKFLNLECTYSEFLKTNYYNSFCRLIVTFINLWKTNNFHYENLPLKRYSQLEKNILMIIFKIYQRYIIEKNSINAFDFDDLILLASQNVKSANLKFKYIIIDEFQDSSLIRLNLIDEIIKYTNAKIVVVGDDWQSIYRFSGCDIQLFLNFTKRPNTDVIKLTQTYRNSQSLINIASKFIEKNPNQIKKNLISNNNIENPIILVPYINEQETFKKVLEYISNISNDIMVLSRNNKDIYNYINDTFKFENNILKYNNSQFKFYTIHKSKGLEAEYVIILNCNDYLLGLPNKIESASLIRKLFPDEKTQYAEERRLFYVAITRCKKQVFILYNKNNPSIFIKEIKEIIRKSKSKPVYFR